MAAIKEAYKGVKMENTAERDKITLRNSVENPAWLMVYAIEPERNIDVSMTYADLFAIYQWVKKLPQKEAENAEGAEFQ